LPLVTRYPYDAAHGMGGIELRGRRIGYSLWVPPTLLARADEAIE
jgi:hypothetical protein